MEEIQQVRGGLSEGAQTLNLDNCPAFVTLVVTEVSVHLRLVAKR